MRLITEVIQFINSHLQYFYLSSQIESILYVLSIDIEVSRLATGLKKVCIIKLPQCINNTLSFASRIAIDMN